MINASGSVAVNGITDLELAEILEIKAKHPHLLGFNPQQLQPASNGQQSWYNGAVFTWNGEAALEVVQQLLSLLLKKQDKAKASGQ